VITLDVLGTPAPKGSSRAILIKGRAVNVPSGSNANRNALKAWDRAVRALAARCERIDGPVWVSVVFRLKRPTGHYNASGELRHSAPLAPLVKPDADKLARATLDSLNGLAFEDDSCIVSLYVGKAYAVPGREGATIRIGAWGVEQQEAA
jgi:Holliday junction resolvase RusA-like endonuclease